jgi:hypothetical protein
MSELAVEGVQSHTEASEQAAGVCPVHHAPPECVAVDADEELIIPKHRRVVTAYTKNTSGETELHLYYAEKELVFDEPELFAFGEGLAKHARFVAKSAVTWGEGYDWPRVQELLQQLLDEGILQRASAAASEDTHPMVPGPRRSPRRTARCRAPGSSVTRSCVS